MLNHNYCCVYIYEAYIHIYAIYLLLYATICYYMLLFTTVPLYHCTTVPLYHCTTVLLYYY